MVGMLERGGITALEDLNGSESNKLYLTNLGTVSFEDLQGVLSKSLSSQDMMFMQSMEYPGTTRKPLLSQSSFAARRGLVYNF